MAKIGDRVGAIQESNDTEIYLYGYGAYTGMTIPPENVGGFNMGVPNPTIKLDNGNLVYGCECWWGPEEKIIAATRGRKIINVEPKRAALESREEK